MKVKVSSITYVKNGAAYIEKCLRSVMNQTLYEIEILVIDGGSTDGTREILFRLANEDNRMHIMEYSGSVGGQFNLALNLARGEYIAVCEADDYILTNKYEIQYNRAIQENADIISGCYYNFFSVREKEYRYSVDTGMVGESYDCLIEIAKDDYLIHPVNGFWNGLYKRNFLIENNIYMNETLGAAYQDISFSFLAQLYAQRIVFLSDKFHCYCIDNPYASMNSDKCIEMLMREYELLKQQLIHRGLWDKYRIIFLEWEICSYKHFLEFLTVDEKRELAICIYNVLEQQGINYVEHKDFLSKKYRNVVNCFFQGKENFVCAMLDHEKQNSRLLSFFREGIINSEKIILFGIGELGKKIYDCLFMMGKDIFIIDNNGALQSSGYNCEKVYCPEDIVLDNAYPIIVANVEYSHEIHQQLKELNVSEERIFICDDEEFFLRKIFVGFGDIYGHK